MTLNLFSYFLYRLKSGYVYVLVFLIFITNKFDLLITHSSETKIRSYEFFKIVFHRFLPSIKIIIGRLRRSLPIVNKYNCAKFKRHKSLLLNRRTYRIFWHKKSCTYTKSACTFPSSSLHYKSQTFS